MYVDCEGRKIILLNHKPSPDADGVSVDIFRASRGVPGFISDAAGVTDRRKRSGNFNCLMGVISRFNIKRSVPVSALGMWKESERDRSVGKLYLILNLNDEEVW